MFMFEYLIYKVKRLDTKSENKMKSAMEVDLENFVRNIIQQDYVSANEMVAIMKDVEERISMCNSQDSEELKFYGHGEDECKIIRRS